MTKPPKKVWMAGVSRDGLWRIIPMIGIYDPDLRKWYDQSRNCSVERLGMKVYGGLITFASKDRMEVEIFLAGARAMGQIIAHLANPLR